MVKCFEGCNCNACIFGGDCSESIALRTRISFLSGVLKSSYDSMCEQELKDLCNIAWNTCKRCDEVFGLSSKVTMEANKVWKTFDNIWCNNYDYDYCLATL